jgi:hypothetical protein
MTLLVSACQCCGEQIEVSGFEEPSICGDCKRWLEDDSPKAVINAVLNVPPASLPS